MMLNADVRKGRGTQVVLVQSEQERGLGKVVHLRTSFSSLCTCSDRLVDHWLYDASPGVDEPSSRLENGKIVTTDSKCDVPIKLHFYHFYVGDDTVDLRGLVSSNYLIW